jgi:hypothetical protein
VRAGKRAGQAAVSGRQTPVHLLRRHLLAAAALGFIEPAIAQQRFITPRPDRVVRIGRVERRIAGVAAPALIYYPALHETSVARAARMPADHLQMLTRRFGPDIARVLFEGEGHAEAGAAADGSRSPLLVFAPGARFTAYDYRTLIEDLAHRGYVVVALTPDDSADYGAVAAAHRRAVDAARGWSAVRTIVWARRSMARASAW